VASKLQKLMSEGHDLKSVVWNEQCQ